MTTALAVSQQTQTAMSHYAPDAIQATMSMAKALVQSKLTPRGIDTPEKAFYVIMKGRELGVPRSARWSGFTSSRASAAWRPS